MTDKQTTPRTDDTDHYRVDVDEAGLHYTDAVRGDFARELERENAALRDVLLRNGFVECDIAACNCGSWHARYGLPERWAEIKDMLADAGYPLCNENGYLVRNALAKLFTDLAALRAALRELVMVETVWQTARAAGTHERERFDLLAEYGRRQPLAWTAARALATKEPVDIGSYAQSVGWDSGLATKEPQP